MSGVYVGPHGEVRVDDAGVIVGPQGQVQVRLESRLSVPFDKPLTYCKGCREEHYGGCLRPGCVYPELQVEAKSSVALTEVREDRIRRSVMNRVASQLPWTGKDGVESRYDRRY